MAVGLNKVKQITKTGTIAFEGTDETLSFRYKPHFYTPRLLREYEQAAEEGQATQQLLELFCGLVVEWDLLLDDGRDEFGSQVRPSVAVDLSVEALDEVPLSILGDVVKQIGKEQNPDPTEMPRRSGRGS